MYNHLPRNKNYGIFFEFVSKASDSLIINVAHFKIVFSSVCVATSFLSAPAKSASLGRKVMQSERGC